MSEAMESVVSEVEVPVSVQSAFEFFTAQFGRWWPRDYSYSREVLEAVVFGNGQGEWCFERGPHGFRCDWARIVEWNPPSKVSFTWQISPKSVPQPDPNKVSLVSVRFVEKGAQKTHVVVEHAHFERHGEGAAEYRAEMASAYGWPFVLQQYAAASRQG